MDQFSHIEFEEFLKDEENQYCFDCGRKPAQWASVNLSIYLCLTCAGIHRGLGVHISYIRSITMDSWSDNQLLSMKKGGNKRLKLLLEDYNQIDREDKEVLFNCTLLDFYRKMLKSEVNNTTKPDLPFKEDAILPMAQFKSNNSNEKDINNLKRYKSVSSCSTVETNSIIRSKSRSFYPLGIERPIIQTKFKSNKELTINTELIDSNRKNDIVNNLAKKASDGVNFLFKKVKSIINKLFGENKRNVNDEEIIYL